MILIWTFLYIIPALFVLTRMIICVVRQGWRNMTIGNLLFSMMVTFVPLVNLMMIPPIIVECIVEVGSMDFWDKKIFK